MEMQLFSPSAKAGSSCRVVECLSCRGPPPSGPQPRTPRHPDGLPKTDMPWKSHTVRAQTSVRRHRQSRLCVHTAAATIWHATSRTGTLMLEGVKFTNVHTCAHMYTRGVCREPITAEEEAIGVKPAAGQTQCCVLVCLGYFC